MLGRDTEDGQHVDTGPYSKLSSSDMSIDVLAHGSGPKCRGHFPRAWVDDITEFLQLGDCVFVLRNHPPVIRRALG